MEDRKEVKGSPAKYFVSEIYVFLLYSKVLELFLDHLMHIELLL